MRNITNIYEAVDQNKFKSFLVLALFIIFVVGVSWVLTQVFDLGPGFFGYALVFSGISSFVSYWFSDKIVLSLSGAREADKKRDFTFYTVVENIALAAGLPMPKVYVIEDPAPNAFATGRDPKHAVVCATRGLLDKLNRSELEGVIGHEMSHVGNYDTRLMSIVAILAGLVVLLSDFASRSMWFGGGRDRDSDSRSGGNVLAIVGIVLALLAPIAAQLIQFAISRRREFFADAASAKLTRNPEGLVRALIKISEDRNILKSASNATAHMYIENPFKLDLGGKGRGRGALSWVGGLFNTHPPVEDRIKALRAMQ
ncbi:MAG: M48 family metallopeptidase [Candidatus Blackburnbacteria bacterium]|nr:M48 family metallopeptidase [Candidatus Blackburnbacteria bacterium]